ncbi:hypothetical protein ZWY2020_029176 [Hordeum vulgare]|nr:hypothetical protein ZWY2020_029176 [Hordeum vulgare]
MTATLFSISLSPQFLSLPSSSFKPVPSALFPSKIPQHRALASAGWRHPLAPLAVAVAVSSDVETEVAEEFSEDLRVFVGNLPFSVDSAQLAGLFEQAGSVEMVEVIYDKLTGRSRGFGFVTMSTVEEVEEAVERLNGYVLDGRALKVNSGPPHSRINPHQEDLESSQADSGSNPHVGPVVGTIGSMWVIFLGMSMTQLLQTCSMSKGVSWGLESSMTGRVGGQGDLVLSHMVPVMKFRKQYLILMALTWMEDRSVLQ